LDSLFFYFPGGMTMIGNFPFIRISLALSLALFTSSLYSAHQDSLEAEGNRFSSPHSHLALKRIGKNFVVSSGLTFQRLSPSVAYNSEDNEYMVVWFDARIQATTGNDVFGQRVSAKGRLLGDNIPIVNEVGAQFDPSIAYNKIDNNYLVAWGSQFDGPGSPDFNDSFGQIVSNDGMLTGNAFHISDAGLEISSAISSAYNSQDNSYLVIGRSFASGPVPGIFGQIVSPLGFPVDNEIPIATVGAPAPNGQVIYNPNTNEYFATWRDQVDENLKGQQISASGTLIGNPIVISSVFPGSSNPTASIAFDPDNDRYLVVFVMFQGTEVLGQFISSAGELIGANFPIGMLDSGETPSVVYSRIHNIYLIVWRNDNDIVARLLSETGDVIGNTLLITKRSTAVMGPRTVQNIKTGEFLVVWPDNRNFSKGRPDIFAQLIRVRKARKVCCKD
jgi:hypothetical protein